MIKILFVDDKPENLYLLQSMFDPDKFQTVSARNGSEALDLARKNIPDLIISDILMPVMDGFMFCRECKKDAMLKNIPFVFYTATYTDPRDEELALGLGADRFILKPQEPVDFLKILYDILREVKGKKIHAGETIQLPDSVVMKEYNEALVRKLEDKMMQAEHAEKDLRKKNAELEKEIEKCKKIEEDLQVTLAKYKTLFDSFPMGITVSDGEGKILESNPAAEKILGISRDEQLRRGIDSPEWRIVRPDGTIMPPGEFAGALKEKHPVENVEMGIIKPGNSAKWISVTAAPLPLEGLGTVVTYNDITERKRAEEALRTGEERYRSLFENMLNGFAYCRMVYHNNEPYDFLYIKVNKTFERLTGLKDVEGRMVSDVIPGLRKSDPELFNIYGRAAKTGKPETFEMFLEALNEWYSISVYSPQKEHFVAIFDIITKRKRAEEAIARERDLLHSLMDNLPDAIYFKDAGSRFTRINKAQAERLGLNDPDQAIGRTDFDFFNQDHAKSAYGDEQEIIRSNRPLTGKEEKITMPGGRQMWVLTTKLPLRDSHGNVTGTFGISWDITGRKSAEEELRKYRDHLEEMVRDRTGELVRSEENLKKAKEQAEEANKAKTVFLSSMSHEIRTPLNAVLGFSQLMLRDESLTARQTEWLNTINRSGEHLLALINDILEISRIESGRVSLSPDLFDLKAFLGDLEKMFLARVEEKNLKLRMAIDGGTPRFIELDGNKLRQIFINLTGNAVKFTDRGEITIRVNAVKKEKDRCRLIAEVEDTGPGITPEDLNKIFNKFEQTAISVKKGGTGLGLSISRQFARMMGGDITVKSEAGKGSCFRLELDFRERNAPELENNAGRRIITGLKKGQRPFRVLIADDEPANRMLLKDLLSKAGFKVLEASDGREAAKEFKNKKPDLVFLDMRMPVMDGYEAIKKMKSLRKDVPVIAVTASAFDDNRKKMMNAGLDGYIRKPYKLHEIYDVLKSKLGVRYAYAKPSPGKERAGKITTAALAGLPEKLAGRMLEAAVRVDLDRLLELIDEGAKTAPALSAKLREMAKSFQYDELIKLLKKRGEI